MSLQDLQAEDKIQIITHRDDLKYGEQKICCSSSSKYGLQFIATFSVSISILLFAMSQLIYSEKDHSYYVGLISLISGYYLRTHTEKKSK